MWSWSMHLFENSWEQPGLDFLIFISRIVYGSILYCLHMLYWLFLHVVIMVRSPNIFLPNSFTNMAINWRERVQMKFGLFYWNGKSHGKTGCRLAGSRSSHLLRVFYCDWKVIRHSKRYSPSIYWWKPWFNRHLQGVNKPSWLKQLFKWKIK